jgi:pyruvate,orthophosphate dikinase
MEAGVANMEKIMGTKFGATSGMPLLVAVRSGARDSMPGMMDTILNLGLNDQSVIALEKPPPTTPASPGTATAASSRCTATSCSACRSAKARTMSRSSPSSKNSSTRSTTGDIEDSALTAEDQQELVKRFKALVKERTGKVFPNNPWDQLRGAAGAVFGSWMNDRAIVYRRKYNIPAEWGTAVNVQAMVFGNTGDELRLRRRLHPQSRPTARTSSTVNSSSTPRAKTSSPASAPRSPCSS